MPNVRFAVGIQRLFPHLAYHHILMIILTAVVVLGAILLAGCNPHRSGLENVYLLSISYASDSANLVARAGYFGVCVQDGGQDAWRCGSGSEDFALRAVMNGSRNDTLGAVPLASHFKSDVVFPGLLIGGLALEALCWAGLATFPGWHEEHDARTGSDIDIKPFPSRPVTNACIMASGLAMVFFLISALWQHIAAAATISAAKSVTHNQLNGNVGAAATVLVWLTFGLSVLPFLGLFIMSLSIRLLDKLIED